MTRSNKLNERASLGFTLDPETTRVVREAAAREQQSVKVWCRGAIIRAAQQATQQQQEPSPEETVAAVASNTQG